MDKLLHLLLLLAIIFTPGCDQRQEKIKPSGREIKIGVIAPLSGPDRKSGENALLGIRTALQMQPFLRNGDRVELMTEDNGGTAEKTLSALQKLRNEKEVAGVLLMAESEVTLPLTTVADDYGIPIVALVATHPDITKGNGFITQLGFDDKHQGTVAALYVRDEMLIDRVAIVSDPANAHYSLLAKSFMQEFIADGGEIIEHITAFPQTTELAGRLQHLKEQQVQLLYLAVAPEQVLELARGGREIGWQPKMMGTDSLLTNIILQHPGDLPLVDGMMATDFFSSLMPKTEYGRKAVQLFRKLYSARQTSYTALGCEGTSLLLHAMNRCNSGERSCVNRMLRSTNGFEGIFGKITIHEDGKTERPVVVNFIRDGEMEFLVKVY